MPTPSLAHPVKMHPRNFVPPVSEYEQGRRLYNAGKPIRFCVTDEQARGWCDASDAGRRAYLRAMEAESLPAWQGA